MIHDRIDCWKFNIFFAPQVNNSRAPSFLQVYAVKFFLLSDMVSGGKIFFHFRFVSSSTVIFHSWQQVIVHLSAMQ